MTNVLKLYPVDGPQQTAGNREPRETRARRNELDSGHQAGLDLVRGLAALGVVLLHSAVPYLRHPMPGLTWSVTDSASEVADVAFWTIELFIMPVFLAMAGFLLVPALVRRGAWGMWQSRWKRLARPLLFGIIVILPIDFYLWLCGWVSEGLISPRKLQSLKFEHGIDRDLWGLSHLWFLLYMLTYVGMIAAVATIAKQSRRLATWIGWFQRPQVLLPTVFAVAVVTLVVRPEVVWGFQHRFEPVPSKWLYSLMFLLVGMFWAAYDPQLKNLLRLNHPRTIMISAIVAAVAVILGRWHLETRGTEHQTYATSVVLAILTVSAAGMITATAIALAVARTKRLPDSMMYLTAASFWLYLVHHPLLVLLHIDLKWLAPSMPSEIKMAASFLLSTAISLVLYEVLVRRTRFGRWSGLGESQSSPVTAAVTPEVVRLPAVSDGNSPIRRAA